MQDRIIHQITLTKKPRQMRISHRNVEPKDFDASRLRKNDSSLEFNPISKTDEVIADKAVARQKNDDKSRLTLAWRQPVVYVSTLLAGLLMVTLSSCSKPVSVLQSEQSASQPIINTNQQDRSILPNSTDPNFVVAVVQKVGPAVVRIDSARTVTSQAPQEFDDPFFQRFFGQRGQQPSRQILRGTGSGFIINSGGQILTNAHVVDGADTVRVTLKDGRSFQGQVLGEDRVTDVAVVKIPATNLPVVALGNSTGLQPGEWVVAIGNPLGLDNTVTAGILSGTDRSSSQVGVPDKRVGFLQTDAAINPGNSGGPLLNSRGEVIGMNTAIISGAQGLGFAIPINTAQEIAQQLIAKGKVDHPYLGIVMATLTPEIKQKLNNASDGNIRVAADQGVLLIRIISGSPAAQAGLRAGDVITKVNNQPVTTSEEVQQLVEKSTMGSPLQIEVQRNGQSTQVAVRPSPLQVQPES